MADDLQNWYAALVALALSNLFKWWPLVDLDFYGKVKFGHLGKGETMDFSEAIVVYNMKVHLCNQLN